MKRSLLFLMLAALGVNAQDSNEDGPGRGVARLSLMNGDVSVRRGDSGDWVAAVINAPLMAEDRVLSGPASRSEVQFDYFHRLRLSDDSEVRFSELEWRKYQIQVARGTVTLSALKGGDAQIELSTPGASVRPLAHGQYRVTVRTDGAVEITVRQGEAEIFTPSGSEKLRPGKTMVVRLSGEGSQFQMIAAIPRDRWDDFNEQRDRDLERTASSYKYVSRDIYGAEDLDGHGEWVYAAPYGYVWAPAVAPGWAPYRHGRWSWLDWYGWSWVSYDPWGWAPYHYGRWFSHGGRWCWYPGVYTGGHHYWSPGYVAWFGFGSPGFGFGVNVGFGFGNWGWVPLAPYEPYHRWYGSRYYGGYRNHNTIVNNVRVVNNTNIYNNYRNARVNNGVSVLEGGDFTRGASGRAWRNADGEYTRASLMQGSLPATPGRSNLNFSDRAVRSDLAARDSRGDERFYSRNQATRVDRVPFEQQRQALDRVSRSTEARSATTRGTTGQRSGAEVGGDGPRAAGSGSRGETPAARSEDQRGWRRADQPARTATPEGSGRSYGSADTWRRFGEPRASGQAQGDARGGSSAETAPQSQQGTETPARQAESQDRGGWRGFGDPNQSTRASDSVVRESQRGETQRSGESQGSRGTWSTGSGRSESPRSESPRSSDGSQGARGTGSTGSGRSETPRSESPRTESPRGGESQRQEAAPSRRGGSDMSSFGQGSWSTGGRTSQSYSSSTDSGSQPAASTGGFSRGSWSTGGDSGSRSQPQVSSPRSGSYGGGSYSGGSVGGYSSGGRSSGGGYSGSGSMGGYSGGGRSSSGGYSGGGFGGGGECAAEEAACPRVDGRREIQRW